MRFTRKAFVIVGVLTFAVPARALACFLPPDPASALDPISWVDQGAPTQGAALSRAAPTSAVRPATCGPGSYPEAGAQGEQPDDDLPARLAHGYRCNLELVGQFAGDGGNIQIAWYGDCAYIGTLYSPEDPEYAAKKGTIVIDASDAARPSEVKRLQTPAMVSPSESLRIHAGRGLLGGVQGPNPIGDPFGAQHGGPAYSIYDVATDCRQPRLLSSFEVPGFTGHESGFAPDGRTYYGVDITGQGGVPGGGPAVVAVDIDDPAHPVPLTTWKPAAGGGVHAAQFGAGSGIGYFPLLSGGLAIVDVSAVDGRLANPVVRVISELRWPNDGIISADATPAVIGGHPYVFVPSEVGPRFSVLDSCSAGLPPYGGVHVIDVADPARPRSVGEIRLETSQPQYCNTIERSKVHPSGAFFYSPHYCDVDDPQNTTALACSWQGSGLRVFDVRDPLRPVEIAYYNPPPRPDVVRGNQLKPVLASPDQSYTGTHVRWHTARDGSRQLWFMSMENGFQIVRFTNGAYPPLPAGVAGHDDSTHAHASQGDELPASGGTGIPLAALGAIVAVLVVRRSANRSWDHG